MAAQVTDEQWMRRALELAERGTGRVSPNPRVGCVITDRDIVLAEGWHDIYGGPHAERDALEKLQTPVPPTATMYVTLEPCNHHGKRPPCTEAIIDSGIRHVVVGMQDPYPLVDGSGIARLRDHGLTVTVGILEQECQWMNRWFIKHGTTGAPYVLLKLATSADGYVAPEPRRRHQLTGPETTRRVHALRAEVDAVMVGQRTVEVDDPELTVREVEGRSPIRIVVDPSAATPTTSRLVQSATKLQTIVVCSETAPNTSVQKLIDQGVEVVQANGTETDLDLQHALQLLGERGIASVMCEGGSHLATSLLSNGLVDELRLHTSPQTIGQGHRLGPFPSRSAWHLHAHEQCGSDVVATYLPASA